MREIKFRAWLPAIKKMTYSHTLDELMNWGTRSEDNGTAIWLQYTGLKDRNGKDIYESDLIQYDNEVYEVSWSEDWAMFTVKGPQIQALMRYAEYGEVIGNVFERDKKI